MLHIDSLGLEDVVLLLPGAHLVLNGCISTLRIYRVYSRLYILSRRFLIYCSDYAIFYLSRWTSLKLRSIIFSTSHHTYSSFRQCRPTVLVAWWLVLWPFRAGRRVVLLLVLEFRSIGLGSGVLRCIICWWSTGVSPRRCWQCWWIFMPWINTKSYFYYLPRRYSISWAQVTSVR